MSVAENLRCQNAREEGELVLSLEDLKWVVL